MVQFRASNLLLVEVIFVLILHGCSRSHLHTVSIQQVRERQIEGYSKKDIKQLNLPELKETDSKPKIDFTNDGSGNYFFSFATPLFSRSEIGELKNAGTDNEIQVVKGQYQVKTISPSGSLIIKKIGYIADENGFFPFVIHLESKPPSTSQRPTFGYEYPRPIMPFEGISSTCLASLCGGNIG